MEGTAVATALVGAGSWVAAMVFHHKFPRANGLVIDLMWWGGLAAMGGGLMYLAYDSLLPMLKPAHLINIGILGVAFFAALALLGLILQQRASTDSKDTGNLPSKAPVREILSFSLEPVNLGAWDNVEILTLEQAAHLWCWEDPNTPAKSGEFKGYFETMRQAIESGELKPVVDLKEAIAIKTRRPTAINYKTRVRRGDLKAFAKQKGMRAPFLFESERKDAWMV